jgi:Protein of unknown function (DUF1559)
MRLRNLTLLSAIVFAGPLASADPPKQSGVDLVPTNAFGFITIRVADLHDMEALKPLREAIGRIEKSQGSIEEVIGVPLADMDRVTLFWPGLPTGEAIESPIFVVTTRQPFNEARVLKALKAVPAEGTGRHGRGRSVWKAAPWGTHDPTAIAPPGIGGPGPLLPADTVPVPKSAIPTVPPSGLGPTPKGPGGFESRIGDEPKADPPPRSTPAAPAAADKDALGPDLYFIENTPFPSVFLLDERTLVFLPNPDRGGMTTYFNLIGQLLRKRADGPLADALTEASKHTIVASARVGQLETLFHDDFPRELVPFRSLLRAQSVTLTADVGAKTLVTAKFAFADAAQARRAEPVFKTLIQLGSETLLDIKKTLDREQEWGPVARPLIDLAVASLDKADVKADGTMVVARVEAEIGPAVAKAMAALPDLTEAAASRSRSLNNLKQIGLAMHNYHDVNGHFPGDILGPGGKPLLSWRVQILPYIEQDNLYKSLDLTKAWDDPVNARVLDKMPDVFRVYDRDPKNKGTTYWQMPTMAQLPAGPRSFHIPGHPLKIGDITDGTSNTLMVVEATDAVPWARPGDLTFDPTKAPKLGDPERKRALVVLGDGSVRNLKLAKMTDEQLRALMTVNGGEVATLED